jgi:hypothetical protein
MKVLVVWNKKEWAKGPHADEKRYKDLPVVEDPNMDPFVFAIRETEA